MEIYRCQKHRWLPFSLKGIALALYKEYNVLQFFNSNGNIINMLEIEEENRTFKRSLHLPSFVRYVSALNLTLMGI